MLLHIEHDAAALAMLLDSPPPECASVAVRLGAPSEVLGFRIGGNPLDPRDDAEPWAFDPSLPGSLVFTWSGTLAPEPFAPDPRNWTRQGQEAFAAFCDQVRPAMEREERTLCVQPHARHALSDVQGALNFLRTRNGQPFGVAFAPASILNIFPLNLVSAICSEKWVLPDELFPAIKMAPFRSSRRAWPN